jgi:folate-dependent phosphoribosylglycinamide formyltransferase PurN
MSEAMPEAGRHRIAILCGPTRAHRNTCATLIRAGLNVVGTCICDRRAWGLPLDYVRRSARRKGFVATLSRIAARVAYKLLDRGRDRAMESQIFPEHEIDTTLSNWAGPVHRTKGYSEPATLKWLERIQPDVLVVHSSYWVGRKVRALARTGIVLGGHPGITPYYRGSHSAFWAVYLGKPRDVGCTVFLVDDGMDTGEIVVQDRIAIQPGDSFVTLGWRGMKRIGELQAEALCRLDHGIALPRVRLAVPENSEFDNPRLGEFLRYRLIQKAVR